MAEAIYKSSDGSDMNLNDLISWLSTFKTLNPEYSHWGFDEITGGRSEFFETKDYIEMKAYYLKFIDNE